MKYGSLILEKKEYVYLKRILNISGYIENFETQKCLHRLHEELKDAQIVDEIEMPLEIVRFNSTLTIASNKGWEKNVKLTTPSEVEKKGNYVSVLSTLGAVLIGRSQGDTIEVVIGAEIEVFKINTVYQIENKTKNEITL